MFFQLLKSLNDCLLSEILTRLLGVAGPKFDIETKRVKAVVVEYEAGVQFSYNYTSMDSFYNEVETWFQKILKQAPEGLQNGFFISYLGRPETGVFKHSVAILYSMTRVKRFQASSHGCLAQSSMTYSGVCCTAPTLQSGLPWWPASWPSS